MSNINHSPHIPRFITMLSNQLVLKNIWCVAEHINSFIYATANYETFATGEVSRQFELAEIREASPKSQIVQLGKEDKNQCMVY